MSETADMIFVGGGLASCITALRVLGSRPDYVIAIVEAGPEICGNHTWSFHQPDLAPDDLARFSPLFSHRWSGQKVKFPKFERSLDTPYYSLTSEALRNAIKKTPQITVLENSPCTGLTTNTVTLSSGATIQAECVIDGRGFTHSEALNLGFQKFLGLEVELASPHGEDVPTIMDASVEQRDGYRFVYVLPLSSHRLLIEDTRYSDGQELDDDSLEQDVLTYARDHGWRIERTIRKEKGVLPISLAHDAKLFWRRHQAGAAPIGLRAGLFHPTTGYSLPECCRVAGLIANETETLTTDRIRAVVRGHALKQNERQSFYRMLNRMLFRAAKPDRRYVVLQRFYTLPQALIERFYAGRTTALDKCRIMTGRPPVPVSRAIRFARESSLN